MKAAEGWSLEDEPKSVKAAEGWSLEDGCSRELRSGLRG